jgi:DNA modification methylase
VGSRRTGSASKSLSVSADLTLDDRNANRGSARGKQLLETSLRRYGAGRSVLVDRRGQIIAGNKTVQGAAIVGLPIRVVETDGTELVVVQRKDLDLKRDKAARELALADNRVAELDLEWDADVLAAFQKEGLELEPFFSPKELADLLPEDLSDRAEDQSEIGKPAELQLKWGTERAQLWAIPSQTRPDQSHRLLCGDSTSLEDVTRLLPDERATWIWTDPPYGVAYEGKTRDKLTIQNDGAGGLAELLRGAFACADTVLADGAPIYVAHPAGPLSAEFARAFIDAGWHWHQTLIWAKDSIVLGRSDYHYQHEPILYGWKKGEKRWFGGRNKASLLEVARPKASVLHPTMKPPELIARCLINSSRPGDIGYEPFAGSGSTLIAAEHTGRICFAMELDPRYVAVCLERLSAYGLEPRLEGK